MTASRKSLRSLDAVVFFVADVQTGFGPFVAVYLTNNGWSAGAIGTALSVGTVAAMASQLPGGAIVDRLADKRLAAAAAALAVAAGAVLFALSASRLAVMGAEVLHAFASAMLGPAVAALSLALVGRAALGERLGRNARYAAFGNGFAAAALGLGGTYLSSRAVFWMTAAFAVPGLYAIHAISPADVRADQAGVEAVRDPRAGRVSDDLKALLLDKRVLAFAGCVILFHLGNAALLPLASGLIAHEAASWADGIVAGCVVVPQAIVALISPAVGRAADRRGTRIVLAVGFAAVPARALLLALTAAHPFAIVAVQALDGLSAAAFGVVVPTVAAELTRGTGRFNLCLGVLGLATTAGATLSTAVSGQLADAYGPIIAFLALAACGALAVVAVLIGVAAKPAQSPAGHQRS